MASVEIIGLLCAGSVKYHQALGSGKAAGVLSRSELAGLLAGLSDSGMHLALAKYAGDLDCERKLIAHVRTWAAGVAFAEGWEVVRGRPTVVNLCALAVFEVVRPNVCPTCQGSGWTRSRSSVVLCKGCNGAAFRALSGREVAAAVGLANSTFCDTWRGRYDKILSFVQDLDYEVNKVLRVSDRSEKNYA